MNSQEQVQNIKLGLIFKNKFIQGKDTFSILDDFIIYAWFNASLE